MSGNLYQDLKSSLWSIMYKSISCVLLRTLMRKPLDTMGADKSLALWRKQQATRLKKKCTSIYSTYSPLSSTHLWLRCSNFFNPSKKNSFGCAANRKSQWLISTPTYYEIHCTLLPIFTVAWPVKAKWNYGGGVSGVRIESWHRPFKITVNPRQSGLIGGIMKQKYP
jgi:hypothetical protein